MENNTFTVIQLGNVREKSEENKKKFRENPQAGRVYGILGIAPTLNTMQGGHRQPYIVVKDNRY